MFGLLRREEGGLSILFAGLLSALWLILGGCAEVRITNPPRTATEQFLLSEAATEAVDQLSFTTLVGRTVYVDSTNFAAPEPAFMLGHMRAKMLTAGLRLVPEAAMADVVMEVRSPGLGIDRYEYLLGLPSVVLAAGSVTGTPTETPLVTPELAIIKNLQQKGYGSIAYVAYWRDTGEVVAADGPKVGQSERDDWWFFGSGPRSRGTIPTILDQGE
jgi:Family of unknown function (DUF6655)